MHFFFFFFFFNDTATTEIYTLSLHDALPISRTADLSSSAALRARHGHGERRGARPGDVLSVGADEDRGDRKSTRLNSSHVRISYAVFCLKKKKSTRMPTASCGAIISTPKRRA